MPGSRALAALLLTPWLSPLSGCGESDKEAELRIALEQKAAMHEQLVTDCAAVAAQIGSGSLDAPARTIALARLPFYVRVADGQVTAADLALTPGTLPCDAVAPDFQVPGWTALADASARSPSAWTTDAEPSAALLLALRKGKALTPESATTLAASAQSVAEGALVDANTSGALARGYALCSLASMLSSAPPACDSLRTRRNALLAAEEKVAAKAAREAQKAAAVQAAREAQAAKREAAAQAVADAQQAREAAADRARVQRAVPKVMQCIGSCNRGNPNDHGTEQWQEFSAGCTMDCCEQYGLSMSDVMSLNQ